MIQLQQRRDADAQRASEAAAAQKVAQPSSAQRAAAMRRTQEHLERRSLLTAAAETRQGKERARLAVLAAQVTLCTFSFCLKTA